MTQMDARIPYWHNVGDSGQYGYQFLQRNNQIPLTACDLQSSAATSGLNAYTTNSITPLQKSAHPSALNNVYQSFPAYEMHISQQTRMQAKVWVPPQFQQNTPENNCRNYNVASAETLQSLSVNTQQQSCPPSTQGSSLQVGQYPFMYVPPASTAVVSNGTPHMNNNGSVVAASIGQIGALQQMRSFEQQSLEGQVRPNVSETLGQTGGASHQQQLLFQQRPLHQVAPVVPTSMQMGGTVQQKQVPQQPVSNHVRPPVTATLDQTGSLHQPIASWPYYRQHNSLQNVNNSNNQQFSNTTLNASVIQLPKSNSASQNVTVDPIQHQINRSAGYAPNVSARPKQLMLNDALRQDFMNAAQQGKDQAAKWLENYQKYKSSFEAGPAKKRGGPKKRPSNMSNLSEIIERDEDFIAEMYEKTFNVQYSDSSSESIDDCDVMGRWYSVPGENVNPEVPVSKKRKMECPKQIAPDEVVSKTSELDKSGEDCLDQSLESDVEVQNTAVNREPSPTKPVTSTITEIIAREESSSKGDSDCNDFVTPLCSDKLETSVISSDVNTKVSTILDASMISNDLTSKVTVNNSGSHTQQSSSPQNSNLSDFVSDVSADITEDTNGSDVENSSKMKVLLQTHKENSDRNISYFMEVMQEPASRFKILFHGQEVLCLTQQKGKYLVLREVLFYFFQKTLPRIKSLFEELGIPKHLLKGKEKERVCKYLAYKGVYSKSKMTNVGIVHIEHANRLYHKVYSQSKCDICVRICNSRISPSSNETSPTAEHLNETVVIDSDSEDTDVKQISPIPLLRNEKTEKKAFEKEDSTGKSIPSLLLEDCDSDATLPYTDDEGDLQEQSMPVLEKEQPQSFENESDILLTGGLIDLGGNTIRFINKNSMQYVPIKDINKIFNMKIIIKTMNLMSFHTISCREIEAKYLVQLNRDFEEIVVGDKLVAGKLLECIYDVASNTEDDKSLEMENTQDNPGNQVGSSNSRFQKSMKDNETQTDKSRLRDEMLRNRGYQREDQISNVQEKGDASLGQTSGQSDGKKYKAYFERIRNFLKKKSFNGHNKDENG